MKSSNSKSRFSLAVLALAVVATQSQTMAAEAGGVAMNHAEHTDAKVVQAKGVVQSINAAGNTITLAHEAIPAINWPAMTMQFKVLGDAEEKVKVGDKVDFELQGNGTDSTISKLEKTE